MKQYEKKYCLNIVVILKLEIIFWEYEDNCVLNSGIDIDILYRNLNSFCEK